MRIHHWRRKEQMVFLHTLDFNKATTFRFVPSADFFAYVEVEGRFFAKGPNAKTISFFHARAEGSRQCWERIAQSPYVNLAPLILLRRVVPANLSEATRCSYDAAEIGALARSGAGDEKRVMLAFRDPRRNEPSAVLPSFPLARAAMPDFDSGRGWGITARCRASRRAPAWLCAAHSGGPRGASCA
jgi:hypothetical protein